MYSVLNFGKIQGLMKAGYLLSIVWLYSVIGYYIPSISFVDEECIPGMLTLVTLLSCAFSVWCEMVAEDHYTKSGLFTTSIQTEKCFFTIDNKEHLSKIENYSSVYFYTIVLISFVYFWNYMSGFNIWTYWVISLVGLVMVSLVSLRVIKLVKPEDIIVKDIGNI